MMGSRTFEAYVFLLALCLTGASAPRSVVVEVAAGNVERKNTPVSVAVPDDWKSIRDFRLVSLPEQRPIDVQRLDGEHPSVVWIVRDPLRAGQSRRYRLQPSTAGQPTAHGVRCTDDGRQLTLEVAGKPVLRYQHAVVESPKGIDPLYQRSGQIHPILTPSGLAVTDDFPPDHAHQHGLFFAWVNTTFAGKHVDFWNQKEQTGGVRHAKVLETVSGPVFGQFTVQLRHEALVAAGGPAPALDEIWTLRAYNVTDRFLVDLESRQSCAGSEPLTINKYHYGGLGIRGNREWFDPNVKGNNPPDPSRSGRSDFLTSEGKGRVDGNHTRPRWVDLSGAVGGRVGGIATLDHPENFRFPQPVRLHPNKPYFCFAPMVLGEFVISPGQVYLSKYRFVVHDGAPDSPTIDREWQQYGNPPHTHLRPDKD